MYLLLLCFTRAIVARFFYKNKYKCLFLKKIRFAGVLRNSQFESDFRFAIQPLVVMFYKNLFLGYIYINNKIKLNQKNKGERKMTQLLATITTEKFQSAEQLWFWFLYSKSVQNDVLRRQVAQTRRPCEILDVETLITKLYLCGKLTDNELSVMKKFGDKRRAPHQHI